MSQTISSKRGQKVGGGEEEGSLEEEKRSIQ